MLSRRVAQTNFDPGRGDALRACVASLLDLPLAQTPDFLNAAGGDYWRSMVSHGAALGLAPIKVALGADGKLQNPSVEGGLCILRGTSPRGAHGHVIVAAVGRDGITLDPIHDPHPSGDMLLPPYTWAAFYASPCPAAARSAVTAATSSIAAGSAAASSSGAEASGSGGTAAAILSRLAPALCAAGFEVQAPLLVRWYNEHPKVTPLGVAHHLDADGDTLALLVGNSRTLWRPFVRWVGERLAEDELYLARHPDALDAYARHAISTLLRALDGVPGLDAAPAVVFADETLETHGRCVSVATAAHVAGLAFYDASLQRSLHKALGPWIAYRAVIVFSGVTAPRLPRPPEPTNPLSPAEAQRVLAVQQECFLRWDDSDEQANWGRLRSIVDAFEIGREHRYEHEMMQFHYEPDAHRRLEALRRTALCARGPGDGGAAARRAALPCDARTGGADGLPAGTQTAVSAFDQGQPAETQTAAAEPGQQAQTQTFLATGEEATQTALQRTAEAGVQHRPVLANQV